MRLGIAQLRFDKVSDAACRADETVIAIEGLVERGAEVVLLPELAASGYLLQSAHLHAVAEPGDGSGPVLSAWVAAAKQLEVAIVGGYCEASGGRLYNSAIAIDASGTVVGAYRKLHLFGAEHDVFEPGDRGLPVFEIAGGRVAMLICYDLRFPEAVRLAALQSANLILVPTAWVGGFDRRLPGSEREIGQIEAAVSHADLNQVFIACADHAGHVGDVTFLGRSLVIDPYGEIVVGPLSSTEGADAVVDIDLTLALEAQERGPGISPRANRRPDVYGALLGYEPQDYQETVL